MMDTSKFQIFYTDYCTEYSLQIKNFCCIRQVMSQNNLIIHFNIQCAFMVCENSGGVCTNIKAGTQSHFTLLTLSSHEMCIYFQNIFNKYLGVRETRYIIHYSFEIIHEHIFKDTHSQN